MRPPDRDIARWVIALSVGILGVVSAVRLPLSYEPDESRPQLIVVLSLPPGSTYDPERMTTEWVVPIETLARSLGDVRNIGAEVSSDRAEIIVTLEKRADPDVKAARLLSDLAPLRSRLPEDATLEAYPAGSSGVRPTAVLALAGNLSTYVQQEIEERLRSTDGVREVVTFGTTPMETRFALDHSIGARAASIRARVRRGLGRRVLGSVVEDGRETPVVSNSSDDPAKTLIPELASRTGAISLANVSRMTTAPAERRSEFHFRGQRVVGFVLFKDSAVSLLRFERQLREVVRGGGVSAAETDFRFWILDFGFFARRAQIGEIQNRQSKIKNAGLEILWSEGEPLRRLLRRIAMGIALAGVAIAITGWLLAGRRGAARAPAILITSIAATLNVLWIASVPLDVNTITAALLGIAGSLPLAMFMVSGCAHRGRLILIALASAAALLVTILLAPAPLARYLGTPAVALVIAVAGSMIAAFLLTSDTIERGARPFRIMGQQVLRHAPTALLVVATGSFVILTFFGSSLDPRSGGIADEQSRVTLRFRLPSGSSLPQTVRAVERAEKVIAASDQVSRFWSTIGQGSATTIIDLARSSRSPERSAEFRRALRQKLADLGSVMTIPSARSGGIALDDDSGERAETDREATSYKAILKAATVDSLDSSLAIIRTRLAAFGVSGNAVQSGNTRDILIALRPNEHTGPDRMASVAASLAERTHPPAPIRLSRDRWITVVSDRQPVTPDSVPQWEDILREPLTLGDGARVTLPSHFRAEEKTVSASLRREGGRFIRPIMIAVPGMRPEDRLEQRIGIDRILRLAPLPAGSIVERPSLAAYDVSREKLRFIALAAALPLALLTVSAFLLNSLALAAVAFIPSALGIVIASPVVYLAGAGLDEMTLFAIAAALTLALPPSLMTILQSHGTNRIRAAYRATQQSLTPVVYGAVVAAILVGVPVIGADRVNDGWCRAFGAAAVVFPAGATGGVLIAPAALLASARFSRRRSPEEKARRHPAAWTESSREALSVRSVTKDYGRFRALHNVSFELTPGIVGLIGPNGAGKTTLLRLITGLLTPNRGQIVYQGVPVTPENLTEYRRHIGFLPQEFNAYPGFTAEQFLDYWAFERGVTSARERQQEIELLLDAVGLSEHAHRRVRDFSGGMRQRVGIARALLGSPPLLIVDEPTTGLDIEARSRFRGLMLSVARKRIVILSTHIASDIEATASRILLLHRGKLRLDGSVGDLVARAQGRVFELVASDSDAREISRRYRVTTRVRIMQGLRIRGVAMPGEPLPGSAAAPTLEEAYLAEIDLASAAAGQKRERHFAFLGENDASPAI